MLQGILKEKQNGPLEPSEGGKTKVKFEWDVKPKRLIYVLLSPFVDMAKIHSDVMQQGYKALNDYLAKQQ
jgi:hypothetical protein